MIYSYTDRNKPHMAICYELPTPLFAISCMKGGVNPKLKVATSAVQSQKAVAAYFLRKQLLHEWTYSAFRLVKYQFRPIIIVAYLWLLVWKMPLDENMRSTDFCFKVMSKNVDRLHLYNTMHWVNAGPTWACWQLAVYYNGLCERSELLQI